VGAELEKAQIQSNELQKSLADKNSESILFSNFKKSFS